MRSISRMLAAAACMMWFAAPMAFADDVSDELAEMRQLVEQMQEQIEAQSEQIQHQGTVIREARQDQVEENERYGASGISAFLQRLEVEGWVAGSWFYNFNNASKNANAPNENWGNSGNLYPFHGNSNSFQVDQVWFSLEHPVDEENRAGFRFDMVFGETACWLGNSFGNECNGNNTSELYVNQAYVQYLAPITSNGILVKAGKFGTPAGAEVAETTANFNITRGNVYNVLQPINHVGVIASSDIGETGFSWQAGVANDEAQGAGADPDLNNAKAIIGQLAWAGETVGVAGTVLWDPQAGGNPNNGLFDIVLTWDPSERLSTWLNFDFAWLDTKGQDSLGYGVATAARYAVTDRVGVSTRLEWVQTSGPIWGWTGTQETVNLYGVTGTVDYALTSNLMLRGEVRWDTIDKVQGGDDEFWNNSGNNLTDNQVTAGVEVVYEF